MERHNHEPRKIKRLRKSARPRSRFGLVTAAVERKALQSVILGAIAGTIGAAQNYGCYPVLGFDNMVSGFTHSISGFTSLYVMIVGLAHLRTKTILPCLALLFGFCGAAYGVNHLLDYNYMFLMAGDGTPYDIAYNLVGGSPLWYPLLVVALFVVYMAAFYGVAALIRKSKKVTVTV